MRPLAFRAPTPEAERLFLESFRTARERYRTVLTDARDGRVRLEDTDFDTGKPAQWGEYPLADETYVKLLEKLQDENASDVPADLRADLERFIASAATAPIPDTRARKRLTRARQALASLHWD
jgi:hypothetical protein